MPSGHKRAGQLSTHMSWHPGCAQTYLLHTRLEAQARFLLDRDGPTCRCCGVDTSLVIGWQAETWIRVNHQAMTCVDFSQNRPGSIYAGSYCLIRERTIGFHVDHVIPLWKVDKSKPNALWYWSPENLQLLCRSRRQAGEDIIGCHERKTTGEAAERAKSNRLQGKTKRKGEFTPLPF